MMKDVTVWKIHMIIMAHVRIIIVLPPPPPPPHPPPIALGGRRRAVNLTSEVAFKVL